MAESSGISWTDATFNPWRGCTEISPACDNCYAAAMSKRNPAVLGVWGGMGTRVVAAEKYWREPLKWNAEAEATGDRKRVFCASLADVFEDWTGAMSDSKGKQLWLDGDGWTSVPGGRVLDMGHVRQRLFKLIDATPNLDWLVLTKRPENILRMWPFPGSDITVPAEMETPFKDTLAGKRWRANVWLGTTVENQEQADRRIPELLKCRDLAPVLFLSCEPLLRPVHLEPWLSREYEPTDDYAAQSAIDWVITGGESGPHARPAHPDWFRSLRDQCSAADVPFHFKQWGEWLGMLVDNEGGCQFEHLIDDSGEWKRPVTWWGPVFYPPGSDLSYREGSIRVGKNVAGRLLDGVLHDAFPAIRKATHD